MKREQRLLYTSSPDRGLDILLELWPKIREQAPDAVFSYTYAPVYWEIADQDPTVGAHAQLIRDLSDQEGVVALGSLPQPDLAKLMCRSLVWAAPSWNTPSNQPFHETSCIGAMEAQAAGLHVVASDWGALRETVMIGRLVGQGAPGPQWRAALVDHIVEGLTNKDVQGYAQDHGPEVAAALGWGPVADQIAGLIEGEHVALPA